MTDDKEFSLKYSRNNHIREISSRTLTSSNSGFFLSNLKSSYLNHTAVHPVELAK